MDDFESPSFAEVEHTPREIIHTLYLQGVSCMLGRSIR